MNRLRNDQSFGYVPSPGRSPTVLHVPRAEPEPQTTTTTHVESNVSASEEGVHSTHDSVLGKRVLTYWEILGK